MKGDGRRSFILTFAVVGHANDEKRYTAAHKNIQRGGGRKRERERDKNPNEIYALQTLLALIAQTHDERARSCARGEFT